MIFNLTEHYIAIACKNTGKPLIPSSIKQHKILINEEKNIITRIRQYRDFQLPSIITMRVRIDYSMRITRKRSFTTCKYLGYNFINCNFHNMICFRQRTRFNLFFDELLSLNLMVTPIYLRYQAERCNKLLIFIKSYKFYRKIAKLPVNGQNTHSNHKTARHMLELNPIIVQPKNKNVKNKRRRGR